MRLTSLLSVFAITALSLHAQDRGYYRTPALHGSLLVFAAEGDLWRVPVAGGEATRLTTYPEDETAPAISPDGAWIAFSASYEGPTEVYVMPSGGGLPKRLTWEGGATVTGWTPDGKVAYTTRAYSTLPNAQLVTVDPASGARQVLPLAQAADGTWDRGGGTLWFTRVPEQGSRTKRYRGGTAQSIWRYAPNAPEAQPLTADFDGTDRQPMWWNGRIYFVSDRDGTMNLWTMAPDGTDKQQLTHHVGWDVKSPALDGGRIVYQLGADIHLYDIRAGTDTTITIALVSDADQLRQRWVDNPMQYLDAWYLSGDGSRVALTARGRVFVAPVHAGRLVEVTRQSGVRYRTAQFLPGDSTLAVLSDQSGEVEWWTAPANGIGNTRQVTTNGHVVRFDGIPSPDGRWIVDYNHDQELWLTDVTTGRSTRIAFSAQWGFAGVSWSPDSRWIAYAMPDSNALTRVFVHDVARNRAVAVTTERYNSWDPAWSPDGRWLFFLSDRSFDSRVSAPWGNYQPEPYFDRQTGIYALALQPGAMAPFMRRNELSASADTGNVRPVDIRFEGLAGRLAQVPVPDGNYGNLTTNGKRLFWTSRPSGGDGTALMARDLTPDADAVTVADGIRGYELSADGKKIGVRKGNAIYVIAAGSGAGAKLDDDARVNVSGWSFPLNPQEDWRQLFLESWRLERDYFYDPNMHGVDWVAMRDKYLPLVDRVRTRADLADLQAQMAGELSTLHTFVYGGDFREGPDNVDLASLGARLERDERAGGWRVAHIYRADPDLPGQLSPLAQYGVDVQEGDVIRAINGVGTLTVPHPDALLRNQAGREVRLGVARGSRAFDAIVTPISAGRAADLRYDEWEYTRRLATDSASRNTIGYVHLRAMGSGNIEEWYRNFYPVFNRQGLIIDVRHNRGGNIESWILEKLLRKAWMYWQPRVGDPYWNMQYAFRGHVVVLVDHFTASDGEAFAEGFKRLGLGKVFGTRTWGGEVWLTSSNRLNDRGIVTAAEFGVYADGQWLVENHGVDPDSVVDNLPHATFGGQDAQLTAAVAYLRDRIRADPRPVPPHPSYPDKSSPDNRRHR